MRRSLVIYDFATVHSEFPYIWGKFSFLFYQCDCLLCTDPERLVQSTNLPVRGEVLPHLLHQAVRPEGPGGGLGEVSRQTEHVRFVNSSFSSFYLTVLLVHCEKRFPIFPTLARMSLTKFSLAGNNLIIPGQRELVRLVTSRLGTGKSLTFFTATAPSPNGACTLFLNNDMILDNSNKKCYLFFCENLKNVLFLVRESLLDDLMNLKSFTTVR